MILTTLNLVSARKATIHFLPGHVYVTNYTEFSSLELLVIYALNIRSSQIHFAIKIIHYDCS